jgi:hypothetical protein
VLSSIEIANVNNRERGTPLDLAAERCRLHFITGRSEWRVRSERRPGSGRLQASNRDERTTGVGHHAAFPDPIAGFTRQPVGQ